MIRIHAAVAVEDHVTIGVDEGITNVCLQLALQHMDVVLLASAIKGAGRGLGDSLDSRFLVPLVDEVEECREDACEAKKDYERVDKDGTQERRSQLLLFVGHIGSRPYDVSDAADRFHHRRRLSRSACDFLPKRLDMGIDCPRISREVPSPYAFQ